MNKKSAIVTLVAVAVLGGGAAFAYPPNAAINVAATATSDGTTGTVLVTVNNANPSCDTRIELDGQLPGTIIPASHSTTTNTVTTTLVVGGLAGRHTVTARTVNCPKGSKEHAKSAKFVVLTSSNHITYPASANVGTGYVITFSGLTPITTQVSVVATGPGKQDSDAEAVDRRGEASLKVKFKKPGTWSLVVTITTPSGPVTETRTITVGP
jgi:hypothetical protein